MFAAQGHDRATSARDRMRPAVDRLVKRAQADGLVRADLAATDIPIIEFMLAAVAEYARQVRPAVWRRYLALMLDALRPARASGSPLPEQELSPNEMVEIMNSNPLTRAWPRTRRPRPPPSCSVQRRWIAMMMKGTAMAGTMANSIPGMWPLVSVLIRIT